MLVCSLCGHPVVYHQANPPEDPCHLCPRGSCLVHGCSCKSYNGVPLSKDGHEFHKTNKQVWGAWGPVMFTSPAERELTN